jgi:hypothetical protein
MKKVFFLMGLLFVFTSITSFGKIVIATKSKYDKDKDCIEAKGLCIVIKGKDQSIAPTKSNAFILGDIEFS